MTDRPRRVAVVVLGMHRSGTSALTRVLALLGGELAAELREAGESGGKAGNWEAQAVSAFDEQALDAAGSAWDQPLEIPPSWFESAAAEALAAEGAELLAEQFGDTPLAVIKDPRICRLAPLWVAMLERRGFEPRFAVLLRNPLEVADSLAARNGFAIEKALLLWLRYVLDAERHTRGHRRAFLTYDALLDDWRAGIATLRSALELPLAAPDAATERRIGEFLSPALRHHRHESANGSSGSGGTRLDEWVAEAQRALLAAAAGDEAGLPAAIDALRADVGTAEAPFRPVLDAERRRRIEAESDRDESRERNRKVRAATLERADRARAAATEARRQAREASGRALAAERRLEALRGSRSWRLTAPLRGLGRRGRSPDVEPQPEPPAPFVIGVGRSGTTLLRLMLDAHPDLAIPPETRFVPRLIRAARDSEATPESIAELLAAERNWGDFGLDPEQVLDRLRAAPALTPGAAVRAFFQAYAARFGKSRWGDKTPPYGSRMPLISGAVPEARFVHVIRDARDVAASWMRFRERRGDDPLSAAHWAQVWSATIVETRVKAAEVPHYVEVRYEDLVNSPEQALRPLCEAIELPFDERMLSYHLSADQRLAELRTGLPATGDQPARSAADRIAPHELATQPPRPDRVGAWRQTLSDEQAREVAEVAGELLSELQGSAAD